MPTHGRTRTPKGYPGGGPSQLQGPAVYPGAHKHDPEAAKAT